MERFGLRDDQWDRFKDILPRAKAMSEVPQRITGCSLKPFCTGSEPVFRGAICRRASAIGRACISVSAAGRRAGVFERIFQLLASDADNEYMMIDATIVRAHQHSAGAQKKTATKLSADRVAD
jgi:transposase